MVCADKLDELTLIELKQYCRDHRIIGFSNKSKRDVLALARRNKPVEINVVPNDEVVASRDVIPNDDVVASKDEIVVPSEEVVAPSSDIVVANKDVVLPSNPCVMILDLETIGFPSRAGHPKTTAMDFQILEMYDTARIVQISYAICDADLKMLSLVDTVIRRDNFSIKNTQFHGITDEISDESGVSLPEFMKSQFASDIEKVSYIIAHNASFDVPVLKSELFRYGIHDVLTTVKEKTVICSMRRTREILGIIGTNGALKNPSLRELYERSTGNPLLHAHNSKYDVLNLHSALSVLYTNGSFYL